MPALPAVLTAYLAHLFRAKELLGYRLAIVKPYLHPSFMSGSCLIRAGTFPADMSGLRSRAGRMSGDEVAEPSPEGSALRSPSPLGPPHGFARSSSKEEEAQGQERPAHLVAAFGAAPERGV